MIIHNVKYKSEFNKREFWIGWRRENKLRRTEWPIFTIVYHLWINIIPMISLPISWEILGWEVDKKGEFEK